MNLVPQMSKYPFFLFFIFSQVFFIEGARQYRGEEGPYFEGDIVPRLNRRGGIQSDGVINNRYRWPENTLVYEYARNFPARHRLTFERAMQHISDRTCIGFRERRNNEVNYIYVFQENGLCYSSVGMVGGRQTLSLGDFCEFGAHVHELIHAIGFYHVQSRPDRDDHVIIHLDNIDPNETYNFEKENNQVVSTYDVEYDVSSIMHYGRKYFSINGGDTITPRKRLKPGEELGQRIGMRPSDVQKIQNMYCPSNIAIAKPIPIVHAGVKSNKFGAQVQNIHDGKYLDVEGGTEEGRSVITWEWHGMDNQKWNFLMSDINSAEAIIESNSRPGGYTKFLHEDMSTLKVLVRGSTGQEDQIWILVNAGRTDQSGLDQTYRIINKQSKRCLFSDRTNRVITRPCNSADVTQLWKITRLDSLSSNSNRRSRTDSEAILNSRNSVSCGSGQFQCIDGQCINSIYKCDRDPDCSHGEDELNCNSQDGLNLGYHTPISQNPETGFKSALQTCNSDQFQCNDGQCISSIYKCDQNSDCTHGEDELNCHSQDGLNLGHHTPISQNPETGFKSALQACNSDQFQCNDGQCISFIYKCDQDSDCAHGEDEADCPSTSNHLQRFATIGTGNLASPSICNTDQFRCNDGQCIQLSDKCDDFNDCANGEDELNCPSQVGLYNHETVVRNLQPSLKSALHTCNSGEFQCNDGQCISAIYKCDRDTDCANGEDEFNCPAQYSPTTIAQDPQPRSRSALPVCNSGEFQCNDGQCINAIYKCDQDTDCTNGEDELNCPSIGNTQQRFARIGTGSLVSRSTSTCSSNQFQCNDGKCVQLSDKCDNFEDCANGEDELNCKASSTLNIYAPVMTWKSGNTQDRGLTCGVDEFLCGDGQCIHSKYKCDGDPDCEGGEDELMCG